MQNAKTIGFIGGGNMAGAIISGIVSKKVLPPENIYVYDVDTKKLDEMAENLGVQKASGVSGIVDSCDIFMLCVKPNVVEKVLLEVKGCNRDKKPVVSIAAGWSARRIKSVAGEDQKVLRLMPNTPLLIGEGMTVFETPSDVDKDDYALIRGIFDGLGATAEAGEKLMDAVTAVSGSGPAYAYLFIDALADGGVLQGLPKDVALKLAAQTVLGAAKMVLETGKHPCALKDAVCSPGGTTIEAVKTLEAHSFKGIIFQAVEDCAMKSKKLSN
jgi:pyrroline-5-carboxylate reductase